ncbi:hypothetical protein [Embleya scabrispora]|uniref:hypothetical protein n=1 Tax=Embleya scabrispora TaxID=159449 RepID=UPI00035EFFA9|nr:hypothetical protein [Embleya scabrispora]MYS80826.1 hypothetical protein [Streptomyces sp. SID5474]
MGAGDTLGRVGSKVKHKDERLRKTHPPGLIEHIDADTDQVRVQPFDPARPAWTAELALLEPDDAIWYPGDGERPADSMAFPIPPGARAPREYGCYRL